MADAPVGKKEAMYRDQVDECDVCKHFIEGKEPKTESESEQEYGTCEIVAGKISECGWCRFFKRKGGKSLAGGIAEY